MMPTAYIVEERNRAGKTWWTLMVGSIASPAMSASYDTEARAIADVPIWVGAGPGISVVVVPLARTADIAA